MEIKVLEITNDNIKSEYTKIILDKLPEWFGNEKSKIEYIENIKSLPYFAAVNDNSECLGFIVGKIHYQKTGDVFLCGVDPRFQNQGIGKKLFNILEKYFKKNSCKYIIVKTLSDIVNYEPFNNTRKFYENVGFTELLTLTEMWDENNPCLIMIKQI